MGHYDDLYEHDRIAREQRAMARKVVASPMAAFPADDLRADNAHVRQLSAVELLHQFALATFPEIIRAHPGYAAKTVAVEAYSVASYMVEQGIRAEKELGK